MNARYYDGQTARARAVTLAIDDGRLVVWEADVEIRRDPIGSIEIMEAVGDTPRIIRFVGGASCEVHERDEFRAWLAARGVPDSRVAGWERNRRFVLVAAALIVLIGLGAYQFGLPMMARAAANRLPASALDTLSEQIQMVLDRTVFSPTAVDGRRLASLLNAFDRLRLPAGTNSRLHLEFRHSDTVGANAMALPSGAIFVTDELVELSQDDRVILAVIAHEAGHVQRRHGLRQIIQGTVMGALVTWYIGDVSALGAAAPTALLQAKYSRDLEREADAYAAETLRLNGMSPSLLADALEALERANGGRGAAGPLTYLSSHPATAERLQWLRAR